MRHAENIALPLLTWKVSLTLKFLLTCGWKIWLWRWEKQDKTVFAHCSKASFPKAFCLKTYSFPFPPFSISSFLMLPLILILHSTYIWPPLFFFPHSYHFLHNMLCKWQDPKGAAGYTGYTAQCLTCEAIHLFHFFLWHIWQEEASCSYVLNRSNEMPVRNCGDSCALLH